MELIYGFLRHMDSHQYWYGVRYLKVQEIGLNVNQNFLVI